MRRGYMTTENVALAAALLDLTDDELWRATEATETTRVEHVITLPEPAPIVTVTPRPLQKWNGSGKRRARAYKS